MAENSKIEWCHHTFNGWRGCTKVSAGCEHCYADTSERVAIDGRSARTAISRRISFAISRSPKLSAGKSSRPVTGECAPVMFTIQMFAISIIARNITKKRTQNNEK